MHEQLQTAMQSISPISEADWAMIEPFLKTKHFPKGSFYLMEGEVEQQIGFIHSGSFRWYYINQKGEEVNYYFFFDGSFVVGYDSFVAQSPSKLFIQAMEPSEVVLLPGYHKIQELYRQSHGWERFGRIIGEAVYAASAGRLQDFAFLSPEERYIKLMRDFPDIFQRVSLAHIASYLGIQGPSLSRIRKRLSAK